MLKFSQQVKTILKLHIVLILLLSSSLFAGTVNNNLQIKKTRDILKTEQTHQAGMETQIIAADEFDQSDTKSHTIIDIIIYNTPEIFGGFEKYFSTQFTLSEIRTAQRFNRELKI